MLDPELAAFGALAGSFVALIGSAGVIVAMRGDPLETVRGAVGYVAGVALAHALVSLIAWDIWTFPGVDPCIGDVPGPDCQAGCRGSGSSLKHWRTTAWCSAADMIFGLVAAGSVALGVGATPWFVPAIGGAVTCCGGRLLLALIPETSVISARLKAGAVLSATASAGTMAALYAMRLAGVRRPACFSPDMFAAVVIYSAIVSAVRVLVSLCKEASSGLSSIDPSLFLGCGSSPGDAPPPAVVRMGVKDSLLDTAVAVPLVAVAACFAPDIARVVSKT